VTRLNNPQSCFLCRRRADGLAVGAPQKLGWFCSECGIPLAKEAYKMPAKELDVFEQRACAKVAELCTGPVTLSNEELPAFVAWAVQEFSQAIRKEIESGDPPF
jgi:ribosomal protein L37AE/L43A